MTEITDALVLQNRHSGERLELQRVAASNGQTWLALRGSLPPHRPGPLLHIHHGEHEEGEVLAGTFAAEVDGRRIEVATGGKASFPAGSAHRWWNGGEDLLVVHGFAKPAVDLDRYLHAVFDVLNSGAENRPPLFYMAHVVWRHRRTQTVLLMPRPIQAIVFPLIVLVGTILGRYRGTDWPGSPARCTGAPEPKSSSHRRV